jgi:hypothetical protein
LGGLPQGPQICGVGPAPGRTTAVPLSQTDCESAPGRPHCRGHRRLAASCWACAAATVEKPCGSINGTPLHFSSARSVRETLVPDHRLMARSPCRSPTAWFASAVQLQNPGGLRKQLLWECWQLDGYGAGAGFEAQRGRNCSTSQ